MKRNNMHEISFWKFKKRREKRKLEDFLKNLRTNPAFDNIADWYFPLKQNRIDLSEWLIGSCEGRCADPKTLLEAHLDRYKDSIYMNPSMTAEECLRKEIETIMFLYHWVYHKQITGF